MALSPRAKKFAAWLEARKDEAVGVSQSFAYCPLQNFLGDKTIPLGKEPKWMFRFMCRVDAVEPSDTWITGAEALAFLLENEEGVSSP